VVEREEGYLWGMLVVEFYYYCALFLEVSTCTLRSRYNWRRTIVVSNATLVAILEAFERGSGRKAELKTMLGLGGLLALYPIPNKVCRDFVCLVTCQRSMCCKADCSKVC
jgi:hypothetical protein